jgi:Zn-dependent M28 family amino/carboxypeptidase
MRPLALLILVPLGGACAGPSIDDAAASPAATLQGRQVADAGSITAEDMRARIGFLADDALRGRDTPSPGLEVAAAYIASEFMRLGLEPAGDDGGYLQRYPYVLRTSNPDATMLAVAGAEGETALRPGNDFYTTAGEPARVEGALVFTGTGIDATVGAALRDRIAVVHLTGTDGRSRAAANQARSAAQAAGARALLVVLDPAMGAEQISQRAGATTARAGPARIPVAHVRYETARTLLRSADHDLDTLVQRAASADFSPVPLSGLTARLATPFTDVRHEPPNVVAVLRGSDPALRDTYVVFSAHMDHVGVGRPDADGDSIFNGADDDASGTSAVLEVAEAFASMPVPPARSLVFLTVSGEEKGLLGSAWYADHPTVPIDRIVANINIDMIGRNAADSVVAIGQEFSSLGPLVQEVAGRNPELGLTVSQDPWPEQRFFFRSDHFNFARKEIPAIFFFTGTHEDYHRPSDHVEKIDTDKAARIARLVFLLGHAIATDADAPRWTEQGLNEVRALTTGRND